MVLPVMVCSLPELKAEPVETRKGKKNINVNTLSFTGFIQCSLAVKLKRLPAVYLFYYKDPTANARYFIDGMGQDMLNLMKLNDKGNGKSGKKRGSHTTGPGGTGENFEI
jgi:hypothetical protein